ncbi:putative transcription factor C2H2 family [Helianthus anomalus]
MEGKDHVSSGLVQGKCACKNKVKEESDESPAPIATNGRKTISNKQRVVASSKSSSSSDNDYQCSSCPRQFSCQQALAGHRKLHKGEWETHLDIPDHENVDQCPKVNFPIKTEASHLSNPNLIAAINWQLSRNAGSMHKDASSSSTTDKLLLCTPKYTLSKPTNVQEGAATSAPLTHVAKPTNTLKGPSPINPLKRPSPTNTLEGPSRRYPFVNPTNNHKAPSPRPSLANPSYTLKGPSPLYLMINSTNTLKASPTNTLNGPSSKCHLPYPSHTLIKSLAQYPLANPINTFESSSSSSPLDFFPNATNNLLRPSLIAPQQSFAAKLPLMPSIVDPNRPIDNCTNLIIGELATALGLRYESMIHKPGQRKRVGQNDKVLRTGSSLFDSKKMMGGNARHFGNNSNIADSRSLLTAEASDSTSRTESGGSSKTHDLSSSSIQPRGGKGIEATDLFPVTPAHEIHHRDNAQSSQGQVPQPDHKGDDVDLDLKL